MKTCTNCERSVQSVSPRCDNTQHPAPDLADLIVSDIEDDINDRRGMHMSTLDEETQDAIRDKWTTLIGRRVAESKDYRLFRGTIQCHEDAIENIRRLRLACVFACDQRELCLPPIAEAQYFAALAHLDLAAQAMTMSNYHRARGD